MKLNRLMLSTFLVTTLMYGNETTVKEEGVKYIKMLGGTLKSELQTHMKQDKTGVAATGFCATKATEITKEVNTKLPKYAKVRRTALKLRNKNNIADDIDKKVMHEYTAEIEAKTFKPNDIKVIKDGNTTRVYKALITKPVCLKCHGSNVSKEIQKIITTTYPDDKAMDFKEGSFRGVIVSEIRKH